jgi:hypothetical protein
LAEAIALRRARMYPECPKAKRVSTCRNAAKTITNMTMPAMMAKDKTRENPERLRFIKGAMGVVFN